jgi:hypothetical protein
MQGVLIAGPEKAGELIPGPTTYLHNGPQDFRRAGLDATAVRRDQEAKFDLTVPEGDPKVPAGNVPMLENLRVTARFSHGIKIAPPT